MWADGDDERQAFGGLSPRKKGSERSGCSLGDHRYGPGNTDSPDLRLTMGWPIWLAAVNRDGSH